MKRAPYLVNLLPRKDLSKPIKADESNSFPPEIVDVALSGIASQLRRDIAYLYFVDNKSPTNIGEILRLEVAEVDRHIKQLRLIFMKTAVTYLASDS